MTKDQLGDYIIALITPLAPGVTCTHVSDDMGVLYSITVPPESQAQGRLIGHGGETINAIRRIVSIVAFQSGIRASVKVLD